MAQVLIIAWFGLSIGIAVSNHGKTETKENNAWHTVVGVIIMFSILYLGGFFNGMT